MAETTDRKLRDQQELSDRQVVDHSDALQAVANELRSAAQVRSQALEDRVGDVREQLLMTRKELQQVSDELPAVARNLEGLRQSHTSLIEETKRQQSERHAQLAKKVQSDGEALSALGEKLSNSESAWKKRYKDLEQNLHAESNGVQKEFAGEVTEVRGEVSALQATMQGLHAEVLQALRAQQEKHSGVLADMGKRQHEWTERAQRRFDDLDTLTAQARILGLVTDHLEGMVRAIVTGDLQEFQRSALDSVEWKLERCVQWLHGVNVKLGLNPAGTMFSTDKFRDQLFDEAQRPPEVANPSNQISKVNAASPRRDSQQRRPASARPTSQGRTYRS
eukprot:gnl/TRDRNA2_/TRDRNA2_156426_c5_seq1.p1 gnl/TRDRNA2_/TRDRNA2_156426_c5~~gnl/TRDRNA2_/TRDRNA2_156426_c5_seq1.p1  ORF type:complete len:370 (-),score=82.30 gnl/TRDRNA2_/TRDRNA2_156426_c5_seq1:201-1205(-)